MTENNQLSDETKNNSTDTSSTDDSSAVIGNHENAIVPHKISNHDKLVQTMVMVDGEWINVNDTNDQANMKEDVHKVNKKVVEAQKGIVEAKNAADSAVKYADSAVSASKVNSDAIVAQNGAITDAQRTANSALEDAKNAMKNVSSEAASIRNDVKQAQDSISSTKTDLKKEFSDATADLQVQVNKNSAAILKNSGAIEIQERTASDAIADLKVADGQIKTIASDAQSNAAAAVQTASAATVMVSDAASDIAQIKLTASEAAFNATDAKSQAAQARATADSFSTRISSVESDTDKRLTANTSSIEQMKNTIALKADQSTVDDVKKDVSNVSAELRVQAGQISSKAESKDIDELAKKVNGNSTAIDQNAKMISAKANQTDVDTLNGSVTNNTSRLDLLGQEIKMKVDSSTVNNLLDSKGFITQKMTQTLIDQKADTINESITDLSRTVNGNNATVMDKIQSITASVDGVQSTVVNKADKSTVTQLANALQIKMTGSTIAQAKDVTLKYTGKYNEYPSVAPLIGLSDVEKGTQVELNFDYTASADVKFSPQFDGEPWNPWGFINNGVNAKKGVKGHYSKVITVGDDSWQKGTAANLAIRCDKYTGTIKVENLLLKKADTKHDVQSTVDMLRDDISLRVTKGDLLSQINITAGHTLIQSNKIYFDADSFVMSPNSKAFIPSAYITNINADKITTGTLHSITINNGNGTFRVDPDGNVYANSMHVNHGSIYQGTVLGADVYSISNLTSNSLDKVNDATQNWVKLKDGTIELHGANGNHYSSIMPVDVSTSWNIAGSSDQQHGLGILDSQEIIIGQAALYSDDNNRITHSTNLSMINRTNLTISGSRIQATLAPDWGDSKGAYFAIQKDNKVGFYVGGGDNGNEIIITGGGPIKLQGRYIDDGFADGTTHMLGNLQVDNLHVKKWLGVDNNKNAIVKTSQGTVAINAYETAEYYFGDIGEGQTDSNGVAYVGIEKLFNETVNTTIPYHVFITAYGPGNIWVDQREHNRFIVKSDQPNLKFSWEIKAKRKGYEHTRLQNVDDKLNHMAVTS